jgi:hypothetical protein
MRPASRGRRAVCRSGRRSKAILFHGTTLGPAQHILEGGPAPDFIESGSTMNTRSTVSERLRCALTAPPQGVLGLVDDLLAAAREQGLQLHWQGGHCRVRSLEGGSAGRIEVPLRKSVFRAALARVAVLCNQRNPNSVSPYGGQGELLVGNDAVRVLRVTFVNTPDEQSLELAPVRCGTAQQDGELSGGGSGSSQQAASGR